MITSNRKYPGISKRSLARTDFQTSLYTSYILLYTHRALEDEALRENARRKGNANE